MKVFQKFFSSISIIYKIGSPVQLKYFLFGRNNYISMEAINNENSFFGHIYHLPINIILQLGLNLIYFI